MSKLQDENLANPRKKSQSQRKVKRKRKLKRREFNETRLGHFIQLEAPLEYGLIMDVSGNREPNADLVESISYASLNPLFRKAKFRRALIEYRKLGCHTHHPKKVSPKTEMRYMKMRQRLKIQ